MRPSLPFLNGLLFLLLSLSTSLSATSTDPIFLEEDQMRYVVEVEETSPTTVSFCNLKIGEDYQLSGLSREFLDCPLFFRLLSTANQPLNPAQTGVAFRAEQNELTFRATAECMDFSFTDQACITQDYLAILSIDCRTCRAEAPAEGNSRVSIEIDQSLTAAQLIEEIFIGGDCFDVSNVNQIGGTSGLGLFQNAEPIVGFGKGIILSTGNAAQAVGPNAGGGTTGVHIPNVGDADLAQLAGINVNDATGIEFDFIPTVDDLNFKFVFASEEYCEFVGFNDAFGFFVSGPGINGTFSNNAINIAQITGTTTNVGVGTVNNTVNNQFFIGNSASCGGIPAAPLDIEYDGYTTIFNANIELQACETYHIKLVIADAADQLFDSAVLLGAGSFDAGGEISVQEVVPNSNDNVAIESCQDGQFHFTRNALNLDDPLTISFTLSPSSTATVGSDFMPFATTITFAPNQLVYILDVDIIQDLISEGNETIIIEIEDDACSCLGTTAELIIQDYVPLEVVPDQLTVCGLSGSTITPIINGGAPLFTYQWTGGSSDPTIDVSPSVTTDYTLTVTDVCGASSVGVYTIEVLDFPTATMSGTTGFCSDDPNPSATIEVTFTGDGPWDLIYTFNNAQQAPITGITTNPYQLVVTQPGSYFPAQVSNAFCTGTVSGETVVELVDIDLVALATDVSCNSGNNGSIDLSVVGGDPNYTYVWDNSTGLQDPTNLTAGPYSVTVTDNNGCTETTMVEVMEPTALSAQIDVMSPVTCNGDFNGSLNLTVNGGTPQYNYTWSNSSFSEDPSQLPADTYSVTVTDMNTCTVTADIILTEPDPIDTDIAVLQEVSCFGGNNGAVDITVTGGNAPHFYNWSGGIGAVEDPDNLEADVYTVEVTDLFGCTTTATVNITAPLPIIATATETSGADCANPNGGAIDLFVAGGTPNYTYLWDNGAGFNEDPSNLSGNTYTVTITDGNSCTQTASAVVTEDTDLPAAQATVQGAISCNNGQATLDGSGSSGSTALSYEWFDEGGISISEDVSIMVGSAGDYTLVVTNGDNGCTADAIVTVDEDVDLPVSQIVSNGDIDCNQLMVDLDGSTSSGGTLTYEWFDENDVSLGVNDNLQVSTEGEYILVVTNTVNGCTASSLIIVDGDTQLPTPTATVSGEINCDQSMVDLDGSTSVGGTLSYSWLNSSNAEIGVTPGLPVGTPGVYTLIVSDADNGCTASTTILVEQDIAVPNSDIASSNDLSCDDLQATLNGTGSTGIGTLSYEWQDPSGTSIGNDPTVDVANTGVYTLIITDQSNGCTESSSILVDQDITAPQALANVQGEITCTNSQVGLDGSTSTGIGTLVYEWQDVNGATVGNLATIQVGTAGDYTLIVTDQSNGCTADVAAFVDTNVDLPFPVAQADGILTCGNGIVALSGGTSTSTGPLGYQWLDSNGTPLGINADLNVTAPDTYTLVITDLDNGCSATALVVLPEDVTPPNSDAGQGTALTCSATQVTLDGSASSTGTNISYEWINAGGVTVGMNPTVMVDQTGIYSLVVTNTDNGCTEISTVEVVPDANLPLANAGTALDLTCQVSSTTLDGIGSSTGANISYEWFDPANMPITNDLSLSVAAIGTYTLVVTNTDNGCSASSSVEVEENLSPPIVDAGQNTFLTCSTAAVTLDGGNSSGNNLSYEWFNPIGQSIGVISSVEVSESGEYTLLVTDGDNGCTASSTVEVIPDADLPVANAGNDGLLTCELTQATLDGGNSTGGTLTYIWQNASGQNIGFDATVSVADAGMYTLEVTDTDNGCTATNTVMVLEDITPPVSEAGDNSVLNCLIATTTLDGSASTGNGTLTYAWLNSGGVEVANTLTFNTSDADTYSLVVTNTDNGCSASDLVVVGSDFDAPQADAGINGLLTCSITEHTFDASNSTGGNLSYEWFDAANTSLGTDVTVEVGNVGNYTLVVTNDDNGCSQTVIASVAEDITPPQAEAGPGASLTCDQTQVSLDGNGSSSGANYSYLWQNAGGVAVGNTLTASVTETGFYTLIVTNTDNGCTASDLVEVTPDANLPTADAGSSSVLDCNVSDATLDGSNSSSGANIAYEWLDPSGISITNNLTEIVNIPGIYTLVVSNTDNGCSASSTVEIQEDITAPQADAGTAATLTCDETSTTLDGGASSAANGTLTYQWLDVNDLVLGNDVTLDVDAAGIYTLLVTAENGCTATNQVEISLDANVPVADVGAGGMLNCDIVNLTLGGAGTSVGPNITYEWLDESNATVGNAATLDVVAPGVYTLLVSNSSNNCETSASITIDQDITPSAADAGPTGTLTCNDMLLTLGGAGTSTGSNITYQWFDGTNTLVGNNINLDVTTPDTYTLMVLNTDNQCSAAATVDILENVATPVADAGGNGILTCDVTQVILDGSNSTGDNLSFVWLNAGGVPVANQAIAQVDETGTFTLVVTNTVSGCSATSQASVVPDANLPSAVALADGMLTCVDGMVTLFGNSSSSVSGGIAYEWLDETGASISVLDNIDVSTAGIYTLVITDTQNGCTAVTSAQVNESITPPTVDAGTTQTLTCGQTEVTLTGSGSNGTNLSYTWLDEDDMVIANINTVDVSVAGTYTLQVINGDNGCIGMAAVAVVPDNNLPTAIVGTADNLTCTTTSILLDGAGSSTGTNITYEWQDEMGVAVGNDLTLSVLEPGNYTLFVLDTDNNCQSQDNAVVAEDITPPMAEINNSGANGLDCDNSSILLDGTSSAPFGNLTFAWSTTGTGNIVSGETSPNPEVDEEGNYTLLVTNMINGCTDETSIFVNSDFTPPTAFINTPDELNCDITSLSLDGTGSSANGNFDYLWTSTTGGLVSGQTTLNPIINAPGTYNLLVVNGDNGCETATQIQVQEDIVPPLANAVPTDQFDCITESVNLDGTGSSTGANITYSWTGPSINNTNILNPEVAEPGIYTLVVTNLDNGCTEDVEVLVESDDDVPSVTDLEVSDPLCYGDNGVINIVEVTGGATPYLYSLDGGDSFTSQSFFPNLDAGNYDLLVQDANGCEYEDELSIIAPDELTVFAGDPLTLTLGENHQIDASMSYLPSEIDTIIWSPSEGLSCTDCLDPVIETPLETRTYKVTVINNNGCVAEDEITLRVDKKRDVYIPNAFSPNDNDGDNDVFMIYGSESRVAQVKMLRIFDRWGALVFEAYNFGLEDPDFAWDGKHRGETLNPAVFVYVTEIQYIDGHTERFTGDLTLVD